jgi:hypothetical protein
MPLSSKIFPVAFVAFIILMTVAIIVAIAIAASGTARSCKDALLRPEAWTGQRSISCTHADHTLMRDGDRWRCSCPNLPREEEAETP